MREGFREHLKSLRSLRLDDEGIEHARRYEECCPTLERDILIKRRVF